MHSNSKLFSLAFIAFFSFQFFAQCVLTENQGISSGGNGQFSNNSTFNNGEQYWSTGNLTIGNANFGNNGSLTVVSGTLTINNANMNGNNNNFTIVVRSGATLRFTQGINIGQNYTIINYGTINAQDVSLNGGNVIIHNHLGATINVASNRAMHINGGRIINNGLINAGELRIQSSMLPALCLLENSTVNLVNFVNNNLNSVSGQFLSCMHISSGYHLNANVSNTEDLLICRSSNVTQTAGSSNFGNATNFSDCSDCASARNIVLPVSLTSFQASCEAKTTAIRWSTASEYNASHYDVEMSRDGEHWTKLETVEAAGTTNQRTDYTLDVQTMGSVLYYKLIQVDFDGKQQVYGPIVANCETSNESSLVAFPNPIQGDLKVALNAQAEEQAVRIELIDLFGRVIDSKHVDLISGTTMIEFSTESLKSGSYMIRTNAQFNEFAPIRVVKQ